MRSTEIITFFWRLEPLVATPGQNDGLNRGINERGGGEVGMNCSLAFFLSPLVSPFDKHNIAQVLCLLCSPRHDSQKHILKIQKETIQKNAPHKKAVPARLKVIC